MESSIELLKSTLNLDGSIDELNKLETQMQNIQDLLGNEALYRIMLDAAIMRDHKCMYLTANPILNARRLFDKKYEFRIADWGGGYPRPFKEILMKSWKAKSFEEDTTIVISEDPLLSNLALEEA